MTGLALAVSHTLAILAVTYAALKDFNVLSILPKVSCARFLEVLRVGRAVWVDW